MKIGHYFLALGLMCISGAAYCSNSTGPDRQIPVAALKKYLAQQGDFCLGKFDWPIDVSESDIQMKTRDAVQMPVLEKLGLAASTSEPVMRKVEDKEISVPVKRYTLTEAGKKFYLDNKTSITTLGGNKIVHHGDFCAAKLSLNKLVRREKPEPSGDNSEIMMTYTYRISAAKWARDPEIQKVFPMLARVLQGEGTLQLQQRFRRSGDSWAAVHPDE